MSVLISPCRPSLFSIGINYRLKPFTLISCYKVSHCSISIPFQSQPFQHEYQNTTSFCVNIAVQNQELQYQDRITDSTTSVSKSHYRLSHFNISIALQTQALETQPLQPLQALQHHHRIAGSSDSTTYYFDMY